MNYENRRYLIIPSSIKNQINFNEVMETSVDTLRLSVDGTKTFVKYNVVVEEVDRTETYIDAETNEEVTIQIKAGVYGRPSIYSEDYDELTHGEILALLSTEEWAENIEETED
jgi:uncharacterized protein YpiB (UPF0302 family)